MATLTIDTPTQQGSTNRGRFYTDDITANNDDANVILWTIPPANDVYQLMDVSIRAINAATVHDINADPQQVAVLSIRDEAGDLELWGDVELSLNRDPTNSWHAQVHLDHMPLGVRARQVLSFFVPPCDDHGSPSGDYRVRVVLHDQ